MPNGDVALATVREMHDSAIEQLEKVPNPAIKEPVRSDLGALASGLNVLLVQSRASLNSDISQRKLILNVFLKVLAGVCIALGGGLAAGLL